VVTELRSKIKGSGLDDNRRLALQVSQEAVRWLGMDFFQGNKQKNGVQHTCTQH